VRGKALRARIRLASTGALALEESISKVTERRATAEPFNPWWITVIAPLISFALFGAILIASLKSEWGGFTTETNGLGVAFVDVSTVLRGVSDNTDTVAIVRFASTDLATNEGEQRFIKGVLSPPAKASLFLHSPAGIIAEANAQSENQQVATPQISGLRWLIFETVYGQSDQNGGIIAQGGALTTALSFGEAVYSGQIKDKAHLINVIVDFSSPNPKDPAPRLGNEARHAAILGGMKAALIKADALGAQLVLVSLGPLGSWPEPDDLTLSSLFEAINVMAPSLPLVRQIDLVSPFGVHPELQDSPTRTMFQHLFATRLPPQDSEALRVVVADQAAMEQLAKASGQVEASKAVFASTQDLAPRMTYLPLLLGITAYAVALILTGAQAVNSGWRFKPIREQGSILYSFIAAMPLVVLIFNAASWLQPGAPWAPDPKDLTAISSHPLLVYGLAPVIGLISGYAVNLFAFDKSPIEQEAAPSLRSILISDVPVSGGIKNDRLGFTQLVTALARFMDNRDTVPPVVLAVTGPWGSGKSSVMRMLQAELETKKRFRFAWFNAWENQDQDKILAAFLRTVGQQLRSEVGFLFPLRLAWVRLRDASYWQLAKIFSPVLLIAISIMLWRHYAAGEAPKGFLDLIQSKESSLWDMIQAILASAAGLTGLAGLASLARWLKPFQEPLSWMFAAPGNATAETTYLDQFRSEFALYRQTVNAEKFVIFIDDLDRCPPEAVVEVLKTVNLIVTSDDGPGKTFFVLGFDWAYIVTCVEMHFAQFMAADAETRGRFGPHYLKKIVTLPVSVPQPSPTRLQAFVNGLDDRTDPPPKDGRSAIGTIAGQALDLIKRPLIQFVLTAVTLMVLVWITEQFQGPPAPEGPPPVTGSGTEVTADGGGTGPGSTRVIDLKPPAPSPSPTWPLWLQWAALMMAVGAAGAAAWQMRGVARGDIAPPEPEDSPQFIKAVAALSDRMPSNPRDVIRLLNLMRVTFFIQEPQPSGGDIFTGKAFSEDESVRLSLFQYQNAGLLVRDELEGAILASAEKGEPPTRGDGAWLNSIASALDSVPGVRAIVEEPLKLRRFFEIYRNLLPVRGAPKAAGARQESEPSDSAPASPRPPRRRRKAGGPSPTPPSA
jgi:hypothetical protein